MNAPANPILPLQHFIPDGRIYLYGSMDIAGRHQYCSGEYHVFSRG